MSTPAPPPRAGAGAGPQRPETGTGVGPQPPEAGTGQLKPRRQWFSLGATLWLAIVWVLLWGEPSFGNVIAGLVVGFVVQWALPLPLVPFAGHTSILGCARLLAKFAWDILVASIHVAGVALNPRRTPQGGVIRVKLRSRSDLYLTLTADLCSLVPGSIIVEAHRQTGTLYVHWFDMRTPEAIEQARRDVWAQEARVMYALASDLEIADAGLPPRRWGGPSAAFGVPPWAPGAGGTDGSPEAPSTPPAAAGENGGAA